MQTRARKANKTNKCTHNIHRRTTPDKEYEKHLSIISTQGEIGKQDTWEKS